MPPDRGVYPPFIGPALSFVVPPMSDAAWARIVWVVLVAAFWAYGAVLARLASGGVTWRRLFSWGAVLMLTPGAWHGVAVGNVDPLLWVLFGLAFLLPRGRGAFLAAFGLLKVYAVWPFLFLLRREGRRLLLGAVPVGLVACTVSVVAMGPAAFVASFADWFRYIPRLVGQGSFEVWNLSPGFLVLRVAIASGAWTYEPGPLPEPARLFLVVFGIAAPLLAGFLTRRWRTEAHAGAVMMAAVLCGPVGWANYVPLVYAPIAWAHGHPHPRLGVEENTHLSRRGSLTGR